MRKEFTWAETTGPFTYGSNSDGTFKCFGALVLPLDPKLTNRRIYGYIYAIVEKGGIGSFPADGFYYVLGNLRLQLEGTDLVSIPLNYYFQPGGTLVIAAGAQPPNRPSIKNDSGQDNELDFQPTVPLTDASANALNSPEPASTPLTPFRCDFPADKLIVDIPSNNTSGSFSRMRIFVASFAW